MKSKLPFRPGAIVCAYLRDSGHEEQELSVEQQETSIREFCLDNSLLLAKIYIDAASPGSTTVGRDAFQEMIRYFRSKTCEYAGLIVWKYNRFARDIDDSAFFKADLRRRGYIIYSINDSVPEGLDGRFFEHAIDWMNARYLEDLRADVKRGQRHLVEQYGALGGTPPRGFKREPIQLGAHRDGSPHIVHRWVPDPDMLERIRTAWSMRASGATYNQINAVVHLYKSTPAYDRFFSNRIYIGQLEFSCDIIDKYCDPIIDQATWDAVQGIQSETIRPTRITDPDRPDHPNRKLSNFLLSGLVYCAQCGAIMNGDVVAFKTTSKYHYEYYACSGQNRHTGCKAKKIPRAPLENAILETVAEIILDPQLVALRFTQLNEEQKSAGEILARQRKELTRNLENVQKRIHNITEAIAEEGRTAFTLLEMLNKLEKEKVKLTSDLTSLRKTPTTEVPTLEELQNQASHIRRVLATGDPRVARTILAGLIHKITAELDVEASLVRGLLEYYYPPENASEGSLEEDPSDADFMPTVKCPGRTANGRHKYDVVLSVNHIPDLRPKRPIIV